MFASKLLTWHYAGTRGMHALLADYVLLCNAHSCGLQVTLSLGSNVQCYAQVMALAFTALICKLDWLSELSSSAVILCMCLGNCAEGFA